MILITGATGFIGSHLVKHMLETTGRPLYVLTRRGDNEFNRNEKIKVLTADISKEFILPEEVTTIYNCAGVISKDNEMWQVNVEGTRHIAEAAFKQRCRLVHLSSAGVIGANSMFHIDESVECRPQNLYERTKREAEKIISGFIAKGLKAQIVRPTIVVGPRPNPDGDSFLQLMRSIKHGRYVNIDGGNGVYNIVHVNEVARVMTMLDDDSISNGETFFVNTPITFRELTEIVVDETRSTGKAIKNVPYLIALTATLVMSLVTLISGKKMPLTYSRLKALTNKAVFSQDKLLKMTGYKTAMPIQEYIRQMCFEFSQKGLLNN